MTTRWRESDISVLHPDFWAALKPAIADFEAAHPNVRVGPRTLHRSNAFQRKLRIEYERNKELFAKGVITRPPLPAAKPGASAHNFDLCAKDESHDVRGADDICPECKGPLRPASLAADVALFVDDVLVPTGGGLPLKERPAIWQAWAAHLANYPALRDGGLFSKPDTPHVEDARWNVKTGRRE